MNLEIKSLLQETPPLSRGAGAWKRLGSSRGLVVGTWGLHNTGAGFWLHCGVGGEGGEEGNHALSMVHDKPPTMASSIPRDAMDGD